MYWRVTCDFKSCPNDVSCPIDMGESQRSGLERAADLFAKLGREGWTSQASGYFCPLHSSDGNKPMPEVSPLMDVLKS